MRKRMIFAAVLLASLLASAASLTGCGGGVSLEHSKSPRQPIVSYLRNQALPPAESPKGPAFIVYGDGTAYRRVGKMSFLTGTLTESQIKALLSSIVAKGFFSMPSNLGRPAPGGVEDQVTVTLTGKSKAVIAAEGSGGDFGAIVDTVSSYKIPGEKEYLPDRIILHAMEYVDSQPFTGKVLEWTADPAMLAQAATTKTGPSAGMQQLTGEQARQAWKLLADASSTNGAVAWRAGGKLYVSVYADPYFPAPGV
jgi:hypothetical protein